MPRTDPANPTGPECHYTAGINITAGFRAWSSRAHSARVAAGWNLRTRMGRRKEQTDGLSPARCSRSQNARGLDQRISRSAGITCACTRGEKLPSGLVGLHRNRANAQAAGRLRQSRCHLLANSERRRSTPRVRLRDSAARLTDRSRQPTRPLLRRCEAVSVLFTARYVF
jgi:hypothetical protein